LILSATSPEDAISGDLASETSSKRPFNVNLRDIRVIYAHIQSCVTRVAIMDGNNTVAVSLSLRVALSTSRYNVAAMRQRER